MTIKSEIHLFLLWERALLKQAEIVSDITSRFRIIARYRLHWSQACFSRNLTRFYGKNLPSGSFKEKECGRGPFLLLVVEDQNPRYEERETSRGLESVNINLFDAKTLYRSWTGGGHKVHASNRVSEARHDLGLLLGQAPEEIQPTRAEQPVELHRDLSGATGWSDLSEFFRILNLTAEYLVLRNFEGFPENYLLTDHGDIDLLTGDLSNLVYVTNAEKLFKARHRVHYQIRIGDSMVPFDFRYRGDGYYDQNWQASMLAKRELQPAGFYAPTASDYFYSLLYHALLHKKHFSEEYQQRLIAMARVNNLVDIARLSDPTAAFLLLQSFLQKQGYKLTEPRDLSVYLNTAYFPLSSFSLRRKFKFYFSQKIVKPLIKKLQS